MHPLLTKVLDGLRRPWQVLAERRIRHVMTLVASGTQLEGSIESKGSLRIEGSLVGEVCIEGALEVLPEASIKGLDIHCQDLLLAGSIEADVVASGSVRILPGGCLRGSLRCLSLQAPAGACFEGPISVGNSGADRDPLDRGNTFSGVLAPMSSLDAPA